MKTESSRKINIIQQVAPHWKDFTYLLDFEPSTIWSIEQKYRYDPEACSREVMQMWLRGRGRQPATWKQLVETLRDCDLASLAEKVAKAIPHN